MLKAQLLDNLHLQGVEPQTHPCTSELLTSRHSWLCCPMKQPHHPSEGGKHALLACMSGKDTADGQAAPLKGAT
jgi:hypothetical protein